MSTADPKNRSNWMTLRPSFTIVKTQASMTENAATATTTVASVPAQMTSGDLRMNHRYAAAITNVIE